VAAITVGGVGDPQLRPEVTTEFEGGVDLEAFNRRATLQLTGYNRSSKDALVARVIAPSVGVVRTRFENIGTIRNRGIEALLTVRPLDTRAAALDLSFNYSRNVNEVRSLRGGEPIVITGNGSQQHQENFPAGGYFGRPITGYEVNAQGLVESVEYGENQFLGYSAPRTLFSVNPQLTLFGGVARVSGLLDYRGGYKQYNSSEDFRCQFARCRGAVDPSASEFEKVRAYASAVDGVYSGYIEDASFLRFRELNVTFALPERFARRYLGSRAVGLTLAGYNLGVLTDYTGVDPEVNSFAQSNFAQSDFLSQAPIRRLAARINVNF
jgi:hypothetical protein